MENLGVEIRKQVVRYLASEISIADLHRSLAPLTWDIDRRSDPETAATGHELDLLLAESAHGDWSEAELRQRLSPFVTSYSITTGDAPISGTSTSSVQFIEVSVASSEAGQAQVLTRFSGTQSEEASA
jgi:hypothetical protein